MINPKERQCMWDLADEVAVIQNLGRYSIITIITLIIRILASRCVQTAL